MRLASTLTILTIALFAGAAVADDNGPKQTSPSYGVREDSGATKAGTQTVQRTAYVPCVGRGYVPYSYPAIGSCPCGSDCCYHPWRYYCGGKSYERQWFRTWLRAHLGKGSMLDQYPCHCRFPAAGRNYISSQRVPPNEKPVSPAPGEPTP